MASLAPIHPFLHPSAPLPTGNSATTVIAPLSQDDLDEASKNDELRDLKWAISEKVAAMRHSYTPESGLPTAARDDYYNGVHGE